MGWKKGRDIQPCYRFLSVSFSGSFPYIFMRMQRLIFASQMVIQLRDTVTFVMQVWGKGIAGSSEQSIHI